FVNTDHEFLSCYDKLTGKHLWTTYNGPSECATPEERNAHPELFKDIDPKTQRIKEVALSYQGTVPEQRELTVLTSEVFELLHKVDNKRYAAVAFRQEAGIAGFCSCSDGKQIFTWYASGVAVCHDLDGKRKWITLENEGPSRADYDNHGYHISPLLMEGEFV